MITRKQVKDKFLLFKGIRDWGQKMLGNVSLLSFLSHKGLGDTESFSERKITTLQSMGINRMKDSTIASRK